MAFTYSSNPENSVRDQVRLLIGDTDSCDVLMQDAEIDSFLARYNNAPLNAAIRCCETIVARFSRRPDEQVGNVRISYSQQAKAYRLMITDLKMRLATEDAIPYAGGISRADKMGQTANQDRVRPDFTKQMMDNNNTSPFVPNDPFRGSGEGG